MIVKTLMPKIYQVITILLFSSLLISCSSYRMDVQQGNVIEPSALNRVSVGMSREQVIGIMGSPLMQDDFQNDRWDYVFYLNKSGKIVEQKSIAVFFDGAGRVTKVQK